VQGGRGEEERERGAGEEGTELALTRKHEVFE